MAYARDVNWPWRLPFAQSFTRRSRSAFVTTLTLDYVHDKDPTSYGIFEGV